MIGFTRTLATDVGRYNIEASNWLRGRTEIMNRLFDQAEFRNKFSQSTPKRILAGRWCADEGCGNKGSGTEEAASLALFLALDDSASMIDQDINCGGGIMW